MTSCKFFVFCIFPIIVLTWISHAASEHEKNTYERKDQICDVSMIEIVGKSLKIKELSQQRYGSYSEIADWPGIISAACKINPANKTQSIVAVAYRNKDRNSDSNDDTLDFVVALIDNHKNRLIASYKGQIEENAGMKVEAGSLWIDTAPYNLAKDVRAFGIDITSGYIPHCLEGDWGAIRTLYIQEGKIIRPVLNDFQVSYWQFIQHGKDRCTSGDAPDSSIIEDFDFSLVLQDSLTNGFHDLLITAKSTRDDGKKTLRKPFYFNLQYNGKEYSTEGFVSRFFKWIEK